MSPGALLPLASSLLPPASNLAAATLVGRVKAPAPLIANNGAGLLSDRGGSIISNNGGAYRASLLAAAYFPPGSQGYGLLQAAPEQFFIPGARVELLDAAGQPVAGPDGQPLATVTAADGSFAFTAALPSRHVVVRATPPGGAGGLSRLVATGVRTADVDLASSVVASYVLEQYVRTQPDRQATLDKLPARVEADTVVLAAAALASAATPASLDAAALVAAGTALRAANTAFNDQMDVVKKILIAAGVSNLGAGLPATDVYMRRLFSTDIAADGSFYSVSADDHLIWRIAPDGRLTAVAGNGQSPAASEPTSRAGRKATEIALDYVPTLQLDDLGRPIVHEHNRGMWRLEPDGTITELHTVAAIETAFGKGGLPSAVYFRGDGTVVALAANAIWALPPGGSKAKLADAPGMRASMGLVELPGRTRWLGRFFSRVTSVTATGAPEVVVADEDPRLQVSVNGTRNDSELDLLGNYYYTARADGKVHRLAPDGADVAVADRSALRHGLAWGRTGRDGKIYLSDCDMGDNVGAAVIRRLDAPGGALTVFAGVDGLPKGFTADGRISLLYPKGLDVAPDGTLWIADAGALLEIKPGGAPKVVGEKGLVIPGAPSAVQFTGVRRLASGKLVARALGANHELLLRQDQAGAWQVALAQAESWGNPWNIALHAWDAKPDGTLAAAIILPNGTGFGNHVQVVRLAPGATTPEVVVPTSAGFSDIARLYFAPDGTLWLRATKAGGGKPGRFSIANDGTVTEAPADAIAPEAADAAGRLYEGDASTFTLGNFGDRQIRRRTGSGAISPVAGAGTGLLGGASLDDSIGWAEDLRFDAAGNLYVRDVVRRQVRRIPADRL